MTVLLTTHYMEEADALCDRVALMHLGTIRARGHAGRAEGRSSAPDATLEDVFRHYTGDTLAGDDRREACVRSAALAGPRVALAERARAAPIWRRYPSRVGTFCLVELQKLRHDRTELFTRAVQPVLWLVDLRRDVQPPPRDPDRRRPVPRLPGARDHRPVGPVRRDLLRHPDHLGARRGRADEAARHADAALGADPRQVVRRRHPRRSRRCRRAGRSRRSSASR